MALGVEMLDSQSVRAPRLSRLNQQLLDGLVLTFVQTLTVPRGLILLTLVMINFSYSATSMIQT